MKTYNRVYASIDLDAVKHNIQAIHEILNEGAKIISVIKADGYGHGAVEIAKEIQSLSCIHGFATATTEEALALRRHHINKPVMVLGYTFSEDFKMLIEQNIEPAVFSYETARLLSEEAKKQNKIVSIHIKIDTGMSRIGYQITGESADEIARIAKLPNLNMEGLFTHFAKSDESDKTFTLKQIEQYNSMVKMLEKRSITVALKHSSNSAGIVDMKEANMDAVRAGIIIYGLWPSDEVEKQNISLSPVMELKSKIIQIKTLEAGRCISYGGTYVLTESRRIATIPVGYGDGYPRSLSNKGCVLIHGKRAPILGRICMDQFMVDVTEIPQAKELDSVTLLGKDEDVFLSMEELGNVSGRFNYEFACDVGKRIPRIFLKNGKVVSTRDYFEE